MKRLLPFLLSLAALAHAETSIERGKRVVYSALTALGGDNFLAMKDRVEDGRAYSFYRERLTGLAKAKVYTRYLENPKPPGLAQRERQTFNKDEDFLVLFLENKAYEVTFRGARPLAEDRWMRYYGSTRRNILYLLRNRLNEPGLIFESRGANVWQNTPVEIVDITDANNDVVTVYFNARTYLPIRQTWTVRDPKTKEKNDFSTLFAKYRDVGEGVQWPFNILAERNGDKVFEMFSDAVTINKGLTDDLFTIEAKMKVLPSEP